MPLSLSPRQPLTARCISVAVVVIHLLASAWSLSVEFVEVVAYVVAYVVAFVTRVAQVVDNVVAHVARVVDSVVEVVASVVAYVVAFAPVAPVVAYVVAQVVDSVVAYVADLRRVSVLVGSALGCSHTLASAWGLLSQGRHDVAESKSSESKECGRVVVCRVRR